MATMATHLPAPLSAVPIASLNARLPFVTVKDPLENLLPGYTVVPANDGVPSYAVFDKDIIKSPNDDRSYRLLLLENGMEVLLVSDPATDKAAASLDVKVGHLSDPEDLQGLAHFCEHLLFMGTEKYPVENDYTEFLTQHSGSSNAFTGMDQTCYYFDVDPKHLSGALDRFAQFFISPLFLSSAVERETNAVDSENSKNLQTDMWRFFQLDKSTSSRDHVYWRFGTGNKVTLMDEPAEKGVDVRERLLKWYKEYYSANLMKLCVVGKESLDDLTKDIVEKFSPAANYSFSPPTFPGSPLSSKELQTTLHAKSVKDARMLEIAFPFPEESLLYLSKPGAFISHLVGHEGPGSVLSLLKAKGWANSVSAGPGNGALGFEFFKVHVDLTAEGLENRDEVASIIFAYIDLINSSDPAEWMFDEVNKLSEIAFRFKEKGRSTAAAMNLSLQMSKPFPREWLLSAPYLANEWRPDIIKATSQSLTPQNCRIFVSCQKGLDGVEYKEKEKWYGTEYTVLPISESLLSVDRAKKTYPELALPKPNAFLPTNLEVFNKTEVASYAKRPLSIRNDAISRVWYKKDDRWWIPRAAAFFLMRSPLVDDTALHSLQCRFFTELVRDSLAEYVYDADLAGLSYTIEAQGDGITLTIDGYNDKLPVLAKIVLERMANLKIDPKRFEIIKDLLRRAFVNWRFDQPYNHVGSMMLHMTQQTYWTPEDKLAELDNVTVENVQEYIQELLKRMHIETLVHGNLLKDDALALGKLAETTFNPSPLTPRELLSHRALIVPEGKRLIRVDAHNPDNANSAVEQLTYIGDLTDSYERNRLAVFSQMVSEPLFEQLRAQEQLGYVVSSGTRRAIAFQGLRVIVQSEKDPVFVEGRLNVFWENFKEVLDKMTEEEIDKYKTTVINKKLEDHKNMWHESSHFWLGIQSGYYDFEQHERDAEQIKTLTKKDIVDFFHTYFFASPERPIRRMTAHIRSHRLQPETCVSFGPAFAALGIPMDEEAQKAAAAMVMAKPTLEVVKQSSRATLVAHGKSEEEIQAYLAELERLAAPMAPPEDVELVEGGVEAYRKSCEPAPHSKPVEEYADLFPKL
ncbi:a-pheromone processing metallopeptidase ste23 [Pseudohyphozyma bogoriensis]|nr:a-pheromone processing metallopeptidase ste23 [Pseudohyphozyma bogoriensis]